jgi:EAL domain-containing protein (putative c-di-GMP-specific phosphodiesterase class I)
MRIVAEGVETREQLVAVRELGIEQIQGYLIGKPLPAAEFIALVQEMDARVAAQRALREAQDTSSSPVASAA